MNNDFGKVEGQLERCIKRKKLIAVLLAAVMAFQLSSCSAVTSTLTDLKGELVGNSFNILFYDNSGNQFLQVHGEKVGIESNVAKTKSVDSKGFKSTTAELSSVITITVDGSNMEQVGNTVIFEETGLTSLKDFSLPEEITSSGGTMNLIDRNLNHFKNLFGTEKVVAICSQLGVPIAVYGGESVYWEIPSDLPKMTKLIIDGKALYIHRANYVMLDTSLME